MHVGKCATERNIIISRGKKQKQALANKDMGLLLDADQEDGIRSMDRGRRESGKDLA
jgi:hypothetical protein